MDRKEQVRLQGGPFDGELRSVFTDQQYLRELPPHRVPEQPRTTDFLDDLDFDDEVHREKLLPLRYVRIGYTRVFKLQEGSEDG